MKGYEVQGYLPPQKRAVYSQHVDKGLKRRTETGRLSCGHGAWTDRPMLVKMAEAGVTLDRVGFLMTFGRT